MSGICTQCCVALCAECVHRAHPPLCERCFGVVVKFDDEALASRAVTATVLAGLGGFATWTIFGWLHALERMFAIDSSPLLATLVAEHGGPAIAVGAYILGSVPYGWLALRQVLLPPQQSPIWWQLMLRRTVVAAIVLAPFFAPFGIARDLQRFRNDRRARAARLSRERLAAQKIAVDASATKPLPRDGRRTIEAPKP